MVLCESPTVILGHAFTTGQIKRETDEKILPNTFEQFGKTADGLGCDASHYTPAELLGKTVPDEHYHEHATVFNVKDRGLVVLSSCSHRGIVNATKQAIAVSGVSKVHALLGGFHLGPAPMDYTKHVVPAGRDSRSRRTRQACRSVACDGRNYPLRRHRA